MVYLFRTLEKLQKKRRMEYIHPMKMDDFEDQKQWMKSWII